jgi:hypothetical protein
MTSPRRSAFVARLAFPGETWSEIEALPEPARRAVHGVLAHLIEEPVPSLAEPFPDGDPLAGAYRLHLPSDGVTIWYVVTQHEGTEIVSIQLVRLGE